MTVKNKIEMSECPEEAISQQRAATPSFEAPKDFVVWCMQGIRRPADGEDPCLETTPERHEIGRPCVN